MKETVKQAWSLWKDSVQWDEKTGKQKAICIWFGLSWFIVIGGITSPWVEALLLANAATASFFTIKYVPIKDE